MKEISARKMDLFLFLAFFKLAFQAVLYYRLIPRAPFNEYQACGLSIHFHLPWAGIIWPFRPEMHNQDKNKSRFLALITEELIYKKNSLARMAFFIQQLTCTQQPDC